ncbi:MAG: hypothetical protein PHQ12_03100 [Chthoniobacteraceae bacterium]|nr:hypothetical protein [Chthoniobacteraceae bacterium]
MLKFSLFFALNVGGAVGWWLGDYGDIWTALLGSAAGSVVGICLVWRYREYFGG